MIVGHMTMEQVQEFIANLLEVQRLQLEQLQRVNEHLEGLDTSLARIAEWFTP